MDQKFRGKAERDCEIERYPLEQAYLEWLIPRHAEVRENADTRLLLFLHGGAYCLHSPNQYRAFLAHYCRVLNIKAVLADYRLAPEHPHPAGIEDCYAVYQHLLTQGYRAENIALIGDSAGGGITLSLLKLATDRNLPMPACAALISPAGDWSLSGPSFYENDGRDPVFHLSSILFYRQLYLGSTPANDPLASPLYADFSGFPPLYACTTTTELLRDIVTGIEARARAAGVSIETDVWPGLCHDLPLFTFLPESRVANNRILSFVQRHLHLSEMD